MIGRGKRARKVRRRSIKTAHEMMQLTSFETQRDQNAQHHWMLSTDGHRHRDRQCMRVGRVVPTGRMGAFRIVLKFYIVTGSSCHTRTHRNVNGSLRMREPQLLQRNRQSRPCATTWPLRQRPGSEKFKSRRVSMHTNQIGPGRSLSTSHLVPLPPSSRPQLSAPGLQLCQNPCPTLSLDLLQIGVHVGFTSQHPPDDLLDCLIAVLVDV